MQTKRAASNGAINFEPKIGPHDAISNMYTANERSAGPSAPRLQMTAAEDRATSHRRLVATPQHGASRPVIGRALSDPQRPGTSGGAAVAPHFPFDTEKPPAVPDYIGNTKWYDDRKSSKHNVIGIQLKPNMATSLHSPRLAERLTDRRHVAGSIAELLGGPAPANMAQLVNVFKTHMSGAEGRLTACELQAALATLDVTDVLVADALFNLLDVHNAGFVRVATVVQICQMVVNEPEHRDKARAHCFGLFNLHGQGYVHRQHLVELRQVGGPQPAFLAAGGTAAMVRVLGDVLKDAVRVEEEQYVVAMLKKGKKKKKKAPPLRPYQKSHVPVNLRAKQHLSYDDFDRYFDASKEVASVFFPRWLNFLLTDSAVHHACVLKAIELATAAEAMDRAADAEADAADL
jgi:hypothetical protein